MIYNMNNIIILIIAFVIIYMYITRVESFVVYLSTPAAGSYTGSLDESQTSGHHGINKSYERSGFHYFDDYYRDYPEYYQQYKVVDDWYPRAFWQL